MLDSTFRWGGGGGDGKAGLNWLFIMHTYVHNVVQWKVQAVFKLGHIDFIQA